MDIFLARQPIFNSRKQVVAYEILYRESEENAFNPSTDGDMATTSVISDAITHFGIEGLAGGRWACINFTRQLLLNDFALYLDPSQVIIEILETVELDDLLIEKIRHLSEKGYKIALDDFVESDRYNQVMPYVDIIKADFILLNDEGRRFVAEKYKKMKKLLLAEKVESHEDFDQAKALGYTFFQGYFFSKPIVFKEKGMTISTFNYMEILKEISQDEPEFDRIANIIKNDITLTYKLLRLINSPAFYTNSEITSVNHALTLLGLKEIKKWITLIMLRDLSSDKPDELIKLSISRAIFCENSSELFGIQSRKAESFLVGLFSRIDTILDKPLYDVIHQLPLKDDVKSGLIGGKNLFHDLLSVLKLYESGNWEGVIDYCRQKDLNYRKLNEVYIDAVMGANRLIESP